MLFCVLHHLVEAESHSIPPGVKKEEGLSLGTRWLGGRGLHTTRSVVNQIFLRVG
jgi:hypothetical protein